MYELKFYFNEANVRLPINCVPPAVDVSEDALPVLMEVYEGGSGIFEGGKFSFL